MKHPSDFRNYREFLKDYYADEKARRTGLTYARFSARAGVKSPILLKQVIDGTKNLTPENAVRFARAIGLEDDQADYFEALVSFNQTSKPGERAFFETRLERIRKRIAGHSADSRFLSDDEFEVVSDWKYWALMTLTTLPGFEERGPWLSERLYGFVTAKEAEEMLRRLIRLELVTRTPNGRLQQTKKQVNTRPELAKSASRAFYEGLFHRASHALKLVEPEEREFGCAIAGISPHQLPELKRRVREFIRDLHDWAHENPKPTPVYALEFGAFPITSPERKAIP